MDDRPGLHHVIIPVLLFSFIGFVIGSIFAWNVQGTAKTWYMAGGTAGGGVLGFWLARWFLDRLEGWRWFEYENATAALPGRVDDGKVVLSLVVIDAGGNRISKEIHGLTLDEWRQLGVGVVKFNFEYSSRKLQTIFSPSRGSTIYEIITPKLKDKYIGILTDSGNGVSVTEDRGERFFDQLRKGDYEILRLLDTPQPPTPERDGV